MNKKEIVNEVNRLAGTQGVVDNVATVGGYQATLVSMVDLAYLSIQTHREEWKFLAGEDENVLVSIPADPVNDLPTYSNDAILKIHRILYEKKVLKEIKYDSWLVQEVPEDSRPIQYTIHPDGRILFNPFDQNYFMFFQYFEAPDVMTDNSDKPVIPHQYHMIIVYKALIHLGEYLFNQSLINAFSMLFSIELGRLMRNQISNKGNVRTGAFV